MTTLYVATTNPGKLREFASAAAPYSLTMEPLEEISSVPEPVEDASTFAGNAELKALAYSRLRADALVLCDDSGLEVGALGGRPGVFSARFADLLQFLPESGLGKDERNNRCLLSLLEEVNAVSGGRAGRAARFVCSLAVAREGHVLLRAEGTLDGEIGHAPLGTHGFGYDPLFLLPDLGLTLAELPKEEKWQISHRGRAFRKLLERLADAGLLGASTAG